MPEKRESDAKSAGPVERSRIKALAALGLGVGVAYTAPIILRLNRADADLRGPTHCNTTQGTPGKHCPPG